MTNHLNPLEAIRVLSSLPDLSARELEVLAAMRLRLLVEATEPKQLPPRDVALETGCDCEIDGKPVWLS